MKRDELSQLEEWYERHQGRISHFQINLKSRKIEDGYGEPVLPITKELMGIPEELLVKQLNQQIGG